MAHRRRVQRRQPRVTGAASTCLVYKLNDDGSKGELLDSFSPKRPTPGVSVVEKNGKLIVNIKERALR